MPTFLPSATALLSYALLIPSFLSFLVFAFKICRRSSRISHTDSAIYSSSPQTPALTQLGPMGPMGESAARGADSKICRWTAQTWYRNKSVRKAKAGRVADPHVILYSLTNQNSDSRYADYHVRFSPFDLASSFFGSLAIGTPPVSYNVILDTGSS